MNLRDKKINKILVVTLSNLGDVILTFPLLCAIRKTLPNVKIDVVVGEKAYGILENNQVLNDVIVYDKTSDLSGKINFIAGLIKNKYDFVIDFRNSLIPYLIFRPSRSLALNHMVRKIQSRYERIDFLIEYFELTRSDSSFLPLYRDSDNDSILRKVHSKGLFNVQNMLIVAPGSRGTEKRWPYLFFVELIRKIQQRYEMPVVLLGDSFDKGIADLLEAKLDEYDVVNLCGKITQNELAVIIEKARLVISNDSAIMHLANFYRRPTVGIFGPSNADHYGLESEKSRIARLDKVDFSKNPAFENLHPKYILPLALELLESNEKN